MREHSTDALRMQRQPSDRHVTMRRGLNDVADRLDLIVGQALYFGARTAGTVIQLASAVGADPGMVAGRRQLQDSQRRRQRHRFSGAFDRAEQASLVFGVGNASSFELEAGDTQQRENQPQNGREHRETLLELSDADVVRWRPCFVLECDDVTAAAADPTQRRSPWDIELGEQVGVARMNDLLPEPVVVNARTACGHPLSRAWPGAHA